MNQAARKALLTLHVGASVGWLGAIAGYVALNVPVITSKDEQLVRAAYVMMEPVFLYALVPLATVSLASGIAQSLITPWGLFRHYWVVISLISTSLAYLILMLHLPAVRSLARMAADPKSDVFGHGSDLPHAIGGGVLLLLPLVLNIYKPRGLTRYGRRKRTTPGSPRDQSQRPRTALNIGPHDQP